MLEYFVFFIYSGFNFNPQVLRILINIKFEKSKYLNSLHFSLFFTGHAYARRTLSLIIEYQLMTHVATHYLLSL